MASWRAPDSSSANEDPEAPGQDYQRQVEPDAERCRLKLEADTMRPGRYLNLAEHSVSTSHLNAPVV